MALVVALAAAGVIPVVAVAVFVAYGWWMSRDTTSPDRETRRARRERRAAVEAALAYGQVHEPCTGCGNASHITAACPLPFLAGVEDEPEMEAA